MILDLKVTRDTGERGPKSDFGEIGPKGDAGPKDNKGRTVEKRPMCDNWPSVDLND